ncbi:MAG TPA: NIPSNAP family protein [Chloroflexota bacterium]|jgi:hypothetical protein|nr:NIPSNAP family protein [Chloroflexota bacterium]
MVYEMRIYVCAPGRLGALHNRFRTITTRKFKEHGIDVIGYWTDKYGESNRLTYICRYEDEAHRTRAWESFAADPEWQKARAESEAPENGGPIVAKVINTLMVPTDYSDMK